MIGVSSVSYGNGVHSHGEPHVVNGDIVGTRSGTTHKTTAVYDQNKDARNLTAQAPVESEEDRAKYYIAKFMREYGLSEEVARAQYEFLN